MKLSLMRKTALFCLALVSVFCAVDYFGFASTHPLLPLCANTGNNGLWLRYLWYAGKQKDPKDWQAMAARLRDHQIKYAYFHVLLTNSEGVLKSHHLENAQKITSFVHEQAPGVKVLAWVYVTSSVSPGGADLRKDEVRKNLIKEAKWLTTDCGFDGVQWDYEFAANNDQGFVQFLKEYREAMPKDQITSVCTPMWYPGVLWGWSDDYFRQVSKYADQLAVMSYDSYLYLPSAYAWLVSQQAVHVTEACASANPNCKVILGLPSYEDVTPSHHHNVESLTNSLRGLRAGMQNKNFKRTALDGIALFADYTTDDQEWRDYDEYWLKCAETSH